MPFRDLFPFITRSPSRRMNYAIAGSTPQSPAPAQLGPGRLSAPSGAAGQYRLAFAAMPVPGLPDELNVGRVALHRIEGPLWTQRTHVLQRPGWRMTYVKHMDQGPVEVAAGYSLTVCTIEVEVPPDLVDAMRRWRDEALAATAFAVAVLDERLALEVVAEDLILLDPTGEPAAVADHVTRVRAFPSKQRVLAEHRQALARLGEQNTARDDPLVAAGRWYLRAAQAGVTPDAIVFLWIALEALSKPRWGTKLTKAQKRLTDVEWVEEALREAGIEPAQVDPRVGRLSGLRAEVVHGGVESPELLREGFYVLEALTRVLLRHRLDVGPYAWPAFPDDSNLRSPLRELSLLLSRSPRTRWRSSPNAGSAADKDDDPA